MEACVYRPVNSFSGTQVLLTQSIVSLLIEELDITSASGMQRVISGRRRRRSFLISGIPPYERRLKGYLVYLRIDLNAFDLRVRFL
jgi:hypothetical protein